VQKCPFREPLGFGKPELVKKSKEKRYERTNADFKLFKLWTKEGCLLVFAIWVNNIIAFGAKADLDAVEADITTSFEAKAEPVFNEYLGNKIDINCGDDGIATIKFTQPVLIQKLGENTHQSCLVHQRLRQYQGLIYAKVTEQI
jgi:hypothetical protein